MFQKRRRGTAIVDTELGILVVSRDNRKFFLPGGGAEQGESRKKAAIRELFEETNLKPVKCTFLFEHTYLYISHKVYLMQCMGNPKPNNEIKYIDYFNGSNLRVSNATWDILERYKFYKLKTLNLEKQAKISKN